MRTYEYRVLGSPTPKNHEVAADLARALNEKGSQGFRLVGTTGTIAGTQAYPTGFVTLILERPSVSEEEIEQITEQVQGMINPVPLTPDPSLMDTERRGP